MDLGRRCSRGGEGRTHTNTLAINRHFRVCAVREQSQRRSTRNGVSFLQWRLFVLHPGVYPCRAGARPIRGPNSSGYTASITMQLQWAVKAAELGAELAERRQLTAKLHRRNGSVAPLFGLHVIMRKGANRGEEGGCKNCKGPTQLVD